MRRYIEYNREERAICAHLFRLLHEKLENKKESPVVKFLKRIKNGNSDLTNQKFENLRIFCEVAIIRDAYQVRKPNVSSFMDDLTVIIMSQENVKECRLYSELPKVLNDPGETHPKQIRQKAIAIKERHFNNLNG